MDILNALKRLRDDMKTWVTNNIMAIIEKTDADKAEIKSYIDAAIAERLNQSDINIVKVDE